MTQSTSDKLTKSVEEIRQFSTSLLRSIAPLRQIGYGLLLLSLFDLIHTITPLNLTNSAWGFQTVGALVERVPVPLIGLGLVFYGERNFRAKWERSLLGFLSWLSLLIGLVFLLLIPAGILTTLQLNEQSTAQINSELEERISQVQQAKEQLATVNSDVELKALLGNLSSQGRAPDIEAPEQLQEMKSQLSQEIANAETQLSKAAEATKAERRTALLKNSIKWNLGALVSSILFISFWQSTKWARQRQRY